MDQVAAEGEVDLRATGEAALVLADVHAAATPTDGINLLLFMAGRTLWKWNSGRRLIKIEEDA